MNNIIVFDLGGSSIKYSIDDLATFETFSVKQISKKIVLEFISKIANENNASKICISAPGFIDFDSGEIAGPTAITDWQSQSIYSELLEYLNNKKTKIFMDNDGYCALLGNIELYKGSISSAVSIVIGTGIGGAYYNGVIQRGTTNTMCEFGMMKMFDNTKETVSSRLSVYALCKRVNEALMVNYNGAEIFDLYKIKNPEIVKMVDLWLSEIAILVFNIIWSFDCQVIFIGGAISQNEIFNDKVIKLVDLLFDDLKIKRVTEIEFSKDGNKVNLLGAKLLDKNN